MGGRGLWMAKPDLTNAYWSIRLLGKWRRVFVVRAGEQGWHYTRLPFGWKYSPAVCQRLVKALVRSAVRGLKVTTDVYLDDIPISAASRRLVRVAVDRSVNKLSAASALISPKSEPQRVQRITFIGRRIDARNATVARGGGGGISPHELSRLLGRLQWLSRTAVGSAPFLAGAYRQVVAGHTHFTRSLARSLAKAIVCATPPYRIPGATHTCIRTFFSDAAEVLGGFRAGVVGGPGCYRSCICPLSITSLQQAEAFASFWAVQIAVYKGARAVAVGVDNDAACAQLSSLSASTACKGHQRVLRKLFWLRAWSNVLPLFFRVASDLNPADPLSRINGFSQWTQVTAVAERRRKLWGMSQGIFDGLREAQPSARVRICGRNAPIRSLGGAEEGSDQNCACDMHA